MKKLYLILTLSLYLSIQAQVPQGFNYQAVVRNNSGAIIANQTVGIKARVLYGSSTGTEVYAETHSPTTNSNGLLNIVIGSGTNISVQNEFKDINWGGGPLFLEVSMDPSGGSSYVVMGTQQLMSVPYALYSSSTGDTTLWRKNSSSPQNIYYSAGTVDIGDVGVLSLLTPAHALRAISTTNSGVYGETQVMDTTPGVYGISNNMSNNNQIGVMGTYNGNGYGAGVVGLGYGSTLPPSGKDIGVYGSAGGTGVAMYSNGKLQVVDGSQGAGKILTSDANGKATWQSTATNDAVFKISNISTSYFPNEIGGYGTKIDFVNEEYDYANTQSNSSYTAPSSGVYHFDARFNFGVTHLQNDYFYQYYLYFIKNGSTLLEYAQLPGTHHLYNEELSITISCDQYLNAGDVINLFFNTDVDDANNPGSVIPRSGTLSGHKVR